MGESNIIKIIPSNGDASGVRVADKKLKVDWGIFSGDLPSVVVLWGVRRGWRQQSIRIFLDQLMNVRELSYSGKSQWLIDFWNEFAECPIDPYKPTGYESIEIQLAKKR